MQQQSYLRKQNIPFTMVCNAIIFDSRISSKAKFYYVYLSSKPNDWKFHTNCIIKEIKEGRDAFYNGLKELIEFGYLERQQIKENGKFQHTDYILKIPHTENTDTESLYTEKTHYNNKDIKNKDKIKKDKKDTTSGFSFQGSYSEIPNYSTNFNSVELHQIKKSAVKENLTTQKQDGQQNCILNSQEKSGAACGTTPAVKPCILEEWDTKSGVNTGCSMRNHPRRQNADFNEFWNEWRAMCKAKGSPTGEKKPAEIEYQKAVKIASHQGIMRTLEAFKDFILLAFENNKHACRWLKNIHWSDFENVIADYKQQAEILKTNLKKQGKPLPIAQKSPEKQQEEVKMKEDIQDKRKAILSRLNANELEFTYFLRKHLINDFSSPAHNMWIENLVFSCKNGIALIGVESDTGVKLNWEKIERILRIALQGKFEFTQIKWKLVD